jgi:hypothetical protein
LERSRSIGSRMTLEDEFIGFARDGKFALQPHRDFTRRSVNL